MPKKSAQESDPVEASHRVPFVDDIQLGNRKETRWVFLSAAPSEDGREIHFRAELVKFDPVNEENITIRIDLFTAKDFSAWWVKKQRAGWKVTS